MKRLAIALMMSSALVTACGSESKSGEAAPAKEKIGVAACDEYIDKMTACMAKDSAVKAASEASFNKTRETWKQAAAQGGPAKDALKPGCEAALATMPPACR